MINETAGSGDNDIGSSFEQRFLLSYAITTNQLCEGNISELCKGRCNVVALYSQLTCGQQDRHTCCWDLLRPVEQSFQYWKQECCSLARACDSGNNNILARKCDRYSAPLDRRRRQEIDGGDSSEKRS